VNCPLQSVEKVTSLRRTPRASESTAMAFQVKQKFVQEICAGKTRDSKFPERISDPAPSPA